MEETVKTFLNTIQEGTKSYFLSESIFKKEKIVIKNISSISKSVIKIQFFDTPKFELLNKATFVIEKKSKNRYFYYMVRGYDKKTISRKKEVFPELFPFLEMDFKVKKVQLIFNKECIINAFHHYNVIILNPFTGRRTTIEDFFDCHFSATQKIPPFFLDMYSFFEETLCERFIEIEIPFILNEKRLNLKIEKNETLSSALSKSLLKQTIKIKGYRNYFLRNIHPEFVHELRVALRKTRSYLNIFLEVLGPKRSAALSISAYSFAVDLAKLRDLDVFLVNINNFLKEVNSYGKEEKIISFFQNQRNEAFEIAERAINSAKFRNFLLRLENFSKVRERVNFFGQKAFINGGYEKLSLLRSTIKKRMKKYGKNNSPELLHRVRISFKKFRYLFELISPFWGNNSHNLKKKLSEIQDLLGFIQDMRVAKQFIEESITHIEDKEAILVLGSLLQLIKRKEKKEIEKFDKIFREFEKISIPKVFIGG